MVKQYQRLKSTPGLLEDYSQVFAKWEANAVIEEVPPHELHTEERPVFYLPHRPVFKSESTSTKVRLVFDSSATDDNGLALNHCFHTGPKLQPDIVHILMRFRQHQIGLTVDITKAFLQVKLADEDKDVTRFLLPDSNAIRVMRFT